MLCPGGKALPLGQNINPQEKGALGQHRGTYQESLQGFPGGAVVENLPANAGDTGSSPGLGRSHMPQSN